MPEILVRVGLSGDDVAQLRQLPEQIETLVRTAQGVIDGIRSGAGGDNPLAGMFGALTAVAREAETIPGIDDLLQRLRELLDGLPTGGFADVTQLRAAIDEVVALLGPVKDIILSGNVEQALERQADKITDLAASLGKETGELVQLGAELREFFRLFGQMVRWKDAAPSPEDVARLLSRALGGLPLDLLADTERALEAALRPLADLLPAGADLDAWRGANERLTRFWRGIEARLVAGGAVDWPRLHAELQTARADLVVLGGVRDRLHAGAVGNLAGVPLPDLTAVTSAVLAVPAIPAFKLTPILEGLRRQIHGMAEDLEAWTPTEDEARAAVRAVMDDMLARIDRTPLGELRIFLVNFQQTLLQSIESLPLRALASAAEAALLKVAGAAEIIDPEAVRKPLRDFFAALRQRVDALPADQIRAATGQLWTGVEDALQQVAALVARLRTIVEGAAGQVQAFLDGLSPTLQEITVQVDAIRARLASFDLDEPADRIVEELHQLRDKVAALDLSSLPGAAVGALKLGAEALRQIDLTAAVQGPIDEALGKIDPTPLLSGAAATLGEVTAQLKLLDPSSVAARLDAPVDQILGAIHAFGPEQLRRLVTDALAPVKDAVRAIDFRELIAPLTRLYAEMQARVDGVLNPDVIFRPLEALYQPILDLVDALDPVRLLALLEPHAAGATAAVGSVAGPPAALTESGGALRAAIPAGPAPADPLFGYRPGDLLVPLIDLHAKLLEAIDALEDRILGPALELLRHGVRDRLQALLPHSIQGRFDASLTLLGLEFDPGNISGRLEEAQLRYQAVTELIATAARAELSAGDLAVSVDVLALLPQVDPLRLLPDARQRQGVEVASARLQGGLDLGALAGSVGGLAARLGEVVPAFLTAEGLGAGQLRQALRDLDPAPIRDEINELFDRVGRRLVGLQGIVHAVIEELALALEKYLLPFSPGHVITLASRLHRAAREQVQALGPATFRDEVQATFDVVKRQLTVLDPSVLADEFTGLREELLARLDQLVDAALPPPGAFDAVAVRIAALRPSQLLAGVSASLQPLSDLIVKLDPAALLAPLIEVTGSVRAQVPDVIARIEGALDEVLAAFPEGGSDRVSVSVSVSATA